MRRTLSLLLLLAVILSILMLPSCGGGAAVGLEELRTLLPSLLEKAELVNLILIGEGIPTEQDGFDEYLFGDEAWCKSHGIASVADIRRMTEEVYTAATADILYRKALSTDDKVLGDYRDRVIGDGVLVLKTRQGWYEDTENEYLLDTLTLEAATAKTAVVTLTVGVTKGDEPRQERTLRLPLVKGDDGVWRCDKLTYVAYDSGLNDEK